MEVRWWHKIPTWGKYATAISAIWVVVAAIVVGGWNIADAADHRFVWSHEHHPLVKRVNHLETENKTLRKQLVETQKFLSGFAEDSWLVQFLKLDRAAANGIAVDRSYHSRYCILARRLKVRSSRTYPTCFRRPR